MVSLFRKRVSYRHLEKTVKTRNRRNCIGSPYLFAADLFQFCGAALKTAFPTNKVWQVFLFHRDHLFNNPSITR